MSFKLRQIGEEHLVILSLSFVVYKMQTAEVMSSHQLSAVLSVKWPGPGPAKITVKENSQK